MRDSEDDCFTGDACLANSSELFSPMFPMPASTTVAYNEIAKRLGLVREGEFISEDLLRFAAVVVEKCARASHDPDRIRRTFLPDSVENAKSELAAYTLEMAEYLEAASRKTYAEEQGRQNDS